MTVSKDTLETTYCIEDTEKTNTVYLCHMFTGGKLQVAFYQKATFALKLPLFQVKLLCHYC